ncbi:MAG: response regulator [Bacteroidetes bacterium]|nr:response regulator [Bacteroidota bacterium]
MVYKLKDLVFFIFVFFIGLSSFGQNPDNATQNKIDKYKAQAEQYKSSNNTIQQAEFLNKIAYLYWENEIYTKAIDYFNQSLEINSANNNQNGVKALHYNIGLIYSDMGNYENALMNFNKGLQIARGLKQKEGIYAGLMNKATVLKNLGKYQDAVNNIKEALIYAQEFNNLKLVRTCYGMLAENYELLGDSENTMKYFELFASIDKHLKSEQIKKIEEESKEQVQKAHHEKQETEKTLSKTSEELQKTQKTLAEIEAIKKQQQLELEVKELELKKQEAEIRNKQIVLIGASFTGFVILVFSLLVLRQFRAKKKANKLLQQQNEQINQQKSEIEAQRDLAHKQKKDITDSIEYAKRIQNALLPPESFIKRNLPEHFILFKPRDIVSGDFYWMMNKDGKIIITAADCTGHGVPGAFMSMLGTAFLNEIVTKIVENKHIYSLQANEILNQLRNYIIDSLHQSGENTQSKDGIDMSLCIIDSEKQKIQFAGAHNPLYIIKDGNLEVIKGDRMPVSIHRNAHKPFTNHEVDFKEKDTIYMFSDGYYDQIGGPKKRKFLSRNFQQLLLEIHKKPMSEQKEILDRNFEEWRDDYLQLDDILVIGIRLEVEKAKSKTKDEYDWSSKTILIAEDTEMNYLFLVEALKPSNVKLLRAKDGEEAIEIFKNNPEIDLILMDINMPKLDGFETTREIKKINKDIPIIAQTALNIEDAREKSNEVGCDDFILKPIKLNLFLSKLNSYLG